MYIVIFDGLVRVTGKSSKSQLGSGSLVRKLLFRVFCKDNITNVLNIPTNANLSCGQRSRVLLRPDSFCVCSVSYHIIESGYRYLLI